ncbi:hypothetical protein E2C01_033661 [Portunus trituberculatus]|uniref:Uncharacterized protein n=1 Tax=Portunus trituberculatus TaxID=210409 RepID=A0A5B7F4P9_PORTR|nr:hypothetical protein [Portunus trituberculatus]
MPTARLVEKEEKDVVGCGVRVAGSDVALVRVVVVGDARAITHAMAQIKCACTHTHTEHSRRAGLMHLSSSQRLLQKELDSGLDICTGGEGAIGSPISK